MAAQTITVNGTTYQVEPNMTDHYRPFFLLYGPRGACYAARCYADDMEQEYMWVMNDKGRTPRAFVGVILRNNNGTLEVVRDDGR